MAFMGTEMNELKLYLLLVQRHKWLELEQKLPTIPRNLLDGLTRGTK